MFFKRLLVAAVMGAAACLCSFAATEQELVIDAGDAHIFGVLSTPEHAQGKLPVAIVSHGFNGSYKYGTCYFEPLNNLGYMCYAFDFPCGSVNSRSDNNTMNMSIIDEQQYLEAVVNYFKSRDDVDAQNIVLIGESQGGLVSALTAANAANNINKLILVFPALCIPDNWNSRYAQICDIPEVTTLWEVNLGRRFFTELRYMNVYDTIGKFNGPVQIIHGDADPVVPVSYSERALKVYPDARLKVIPKAGHGFKPDELMVSLGQITEFIKQCDSKK